MQIQTVNGTFKRICLDDATKLKMGELIYGVIGGSKLKKKHFNKFGWMLHTHFTATLADEPKRKVMVDAVFKLQKQAKFDTLNLKDVAFAHMKDLMNADRKMIFRIVDSLDDIIQLKVRNMMRTAVFQSSPSVRDKTALNSQVVDSCVPRNYFWRTWKTTSSETSGDNDDDKKNVK